MDVVWERSVVMSGWGKEGRKVGASREKKEKQTRSFDPSSTPF
jgi:hypothetical protein